MNYEIGSSVPKKLLEKFKSQATSRFDLPYFCMCYEVLAGLANKHTEDDKGFHFPYEALSKAFGGKRKYVLNFRSVNDRFGFLHKHVWYDGKRKLVSYQATPKLLSEMSTDILRGILVKSPLVDMRGRVATLRGHVLMSRNKDGSAAKNPDNKKPMPMYVTVNTNALHAACAIVRDIMNGEDWEGKYDDLKVEALVAEYMAKRNTSFTPQEWAKRQLLQLGDVLARANARDDDKVGQQYSQSKPYGRWYVDRGSVLAKTSFVRKVAYIEHYHYDIANCGLTIAMQLTDEEHPHIQSYMDNKVATRERLAQLSGVPVSLMKQIITAYLYKGSVFSFDKQLANLLGTEGMKQEELDTLVEKKQRWIASEKVGGELFEDIRALNKEVLADALAKGSKSGRKSIVNAHGFEMVVKSGEDSKLLACIVQGWESYLLKVLMDCPYVVGCQTILHDGWTTDEPMDIEVVQQYLYEQTGFLVKIEQD